MNLATEKAAEVEQPLASERCEHGIDAKRCRCFRHAFVSTPVEVRTQGVRSNVPDWARRVAYHCAMSRVQPPEREELVTVREAASAWHVERESIHRWIRNGTLSIFTYSDPLRATRKAFLAARMLKRSSLENDFNVSKASLRSAINNGVFGAKKLTRYSLDDVATLRRLEAPGTDGAVAVDALSSSFSGRRMSVPPYDFEAALKTYREEALEPKDLPLWFWDRPRCPNFIPPTGVFFFTCGETTVIAGTPAERRTHVLRSEGWELDKTGRLRESAACHWTEVEGEHDEGTCPPGYEERNRKYEAMVADWDTCFNRAKRKLRANRK